MKYLLTFSLSFAVLLGAMCGFRYYRSQHFGRSDAGVEGALTHTPFDILFIGSSHTYLTYDVAAVERATGRRAYLIAYNGMQLTSMAPVVRYLVSNSRTRPKTIVLEAYSSNLAHPPSVSDSRLYFESPPPLKTMLVRNYLREHPGLNGYTDAFDLIANRGNEQILTYWLTSHVIGRNTYHGANRTSIGGGVDATRFAGFKAHLATDEPNQGQIQALHDIIESARSSGVQLLLVESPMPRPVSQTPGIQKLKRAFETEAERCQVPYLDGDRVFPNDAPEFFKDDNHLSEAGRQRFTATVSHLFLRQQDSGAGQTSTIASR